MKYIDSEKLIKAIEEKGLDCSFALKMERLDTLALIDELQQEQPMPDSTKLIGLWYEVKDKELEEAAERYEEEFTLQLYDGGERTIVCLKDVFVAGAKWQKEQMIKEAVEVMVVKDKNGELSYRYNTLELPVWVSLLKDGDKLKWIIVKEDE